jgi:hypothetical protein
MLVYAPTGIAALALALVPVTTSAAVESGQLELTKNLSATKDGIISTLVVTNASAMPVKDVLLQDDPSGATWLYDFTGKPTATSGTIVTATDSRLVWRGDLEPGAKATITYLLSADPSSPKAQAYAQAAKDALPTTLANKASLTFDGHVSEPCAVSHTNLPTTTSLPGQPNLKPLSDAATPEHPDCKVAVDPPARTIAKPGTPANTGENAAHPGAPRTGGGGAAHNLHRTDPVAEQTATDSPDSGLSAAGVAALAVPGGMAALAGLWYLSRRRRNGA